MLPASAFTGCTVQFSHVVDRMYVQLSLRAAIVGFVASSDLAGALQVQASAKWRSASGSGESTRTYCMPYRTNQTVSDLPVVVDVDDKADKRYQLSCLRPDVSLSLVVSTSPARVPCHRTPPRRVSRTAVSH